MVLSLSTHPPKICFASIATASHLHKVVTLSRSVFKLCKSYDISFQLWCIDSNDVVLNEIDVRGYNDLMEHSQASKVIEKYEGSSDHIRWSLKPVMISELLKNHDKVIYLDNDTFFFNDPAFLFDELENHDILLTPHHYPRNPLENQNWLEANFKVGLYNAGFVGVNKNGKHVMDWWADCCLYRCEKSLLRGLFDDQKYLDLVPVIHPNTKVLEHKGCNVAGWNTEVCERVKQEDGTILIDDIWPIVFIHFNGFTNRAIINGDDPLLRPYFEKYLDALQTQDSTIKAEELWKENTRWDQFKLAAWRFLDRLNKKAP